MRASCKQGVCRISTGRLGSTRARVALGVLPVLTALVLASPAAAFHISGAPYNGGVSGGGSISFSVSGDRSFVTNLRLNGPIDGDTCTLISAEYFDSVPVVNHAFDNGDVSGTFPGVQRAQGNLSIFLPGDPVFPPCSINQSWNATTTASPIASEECQSAISGVNKAKKKVKKAKKKVKKADTPKAEKKAKKKLKKAKKKLKKAKQQQALNCSPARSDDGELRAQPSQPDVGESDDGSTVLRELEVIPKN